MDGSFGYRIGIEEEFFVFDARTRRLVSRADPRFLAAVRRRLGEQVMPEMLQSQIEAVTPPCATLEAARNHLAQYRRTLAEEAAKRRLGIAALGTFPLAQWGEQRLTRKRRYDDILDDLQMLGYRNMLCGMHVHVEVADPQRRVDLMLRATPYLPLLLALSTSSPFWQGRVTGLSGYRLAAYDELPRTGLPELFRTNADYDAYVAALVEAGIIPDASYIWWALRPSHKLPTLELRVADSCTRLDDAMAIAALFRCLVRALERDGDLDADFDRVGRAITAENKWHAQRHGMRATFVEPFRREAIAAAAWLDELIEILAPDIAAFDCTAEIARLRRIARFGTSADEQMRIHSQAIESGRTPLAALKEVVDWAAAATRDTESAASGVDGAERASPSHAAPL